MSCKRYEELLPALAAGELDARSASDVQGHVDVCDACRESLAIFTRLEQALVMRREVVPPVDRFITLMPTPLVRPSLRRVLNALSSPPALASMGFIWLGALMFTHRDATATFLGKSLALSSVKMSFNDTLGKALATAGGSDMTLMIAAYAIVTLLILVSTGLITARFLRDPN